MTFTSTPFNQQGTNYNPQTSENRNLSTFGRSAFNHMRTQNQHNMQSTSNGNVTNLTGSTFPKRPSNLTSQSSDHIQMLYSGQQKFTTVRSQQVLQSSKC